MKIKTTFCILLIITINAITAQTPYENAISKSFDCLDKNDLIGAEQCLKDALKEEPANPRNYLLLGNLGTIQRTLEKLDDALKSYTLGINLNPENITLLNNRALLCVEMGDLQQALADYNKILELKPNLEQQRYERGLLYLQEGNIIEAEEDFSFLIKQNEHSFLGRLGYAKLETQRGNDKNAERIYNYLIEKQPKDYSLFEERSEIYRKMEKYRLAKQDIDKVFILKESPDASNYLLRCLIKIGLYEKESALEDLEKSRDLGLEDKIYNKIIKQLKHKK